MNKERFIEELSKQTNLTKADCSRINEILEAHFIIGRNNKFKILDEIREKLNVDPDLAETIYNKASEIFKKNLKQRIKHPFKKVNK